MSQTLFVGNLPSQTTELELTTIFARHGRVLRAWLEPFKTSPKHARQGFVELHADDAENVLWILNRSWYKNRQINVQSKKHQPRVRKSTEREVYSVSGY